MERDRHSGMRVLFQDEVAVVTGDITGATIDMEDAAEGNGAESLEYVISVGTIAVAGGALQVIVQDSPDDSVWTAVPDELVIGAQPLIPIAAVNTVYRVGSISKKRYQRCFVDELATTTAGQVSIVAIIQDMRRGPQADQSS